MVESATILGANRQEAEQQLLEALQFEMTLANVSAPRPAADRRRKGGAENRPAARPEQLT
jgi:hypothetical protein